MSHPPRQQRFIHSIRFKLLLVSLTLLAIPWAGYRYIQETESFLRQSQEEMLLETARAVATILHSHEELFTPLSVLEEPGHREAMLYVEPLGQPVQVDGYTEEWSSYLQNLRSHPEEGEVHFQSLLGEHGAYLYLLLMVRDDRVLYLAPGERRLDRGDRIDLALEQADGSFHRYRIATSGPGWVSAEKMSTDRDSPYSQGNEVRIQGEWQETTEGYTVELRIPRYLAGNRMAFSVTDIDNPAGDASVTATTAMDSLEDLGSLIRPNPEISGLIEEVGQRNARIWVLDINGQVLARKGRLTTPEGSPNRPESPPPLPLVSLLFRLVLDRPSDDFADARKYSSRLDGAEIEGALEGRGSAMRSQTPDGQAVILSAAWPVQSPAGVIGAVLVEQSTNRILSLQNAALERLFGVTLLLFALTGLALLGFASLLAGRIRRLRNRVEEAVTGDGRIMGELPASRSSDEIGDLGRSFSGVLDRLSEYNRYLEAMTSRLAHELNTPLAVVKSSLEMLDASAPEERHRQYIDRAREGAGRLGVILQRMREATRLEQLLRQTEVETFDLCQLAGIACDSYRSAFPGVGFACETTDDDCRIPGAPDLVSQALDKLVGNAVDFHTPGSTIQLKVARSGHEVRLQVSNLGPPLPTEMSHRLFESMVSLREKKGDEPHLGLGLYLVRLICEFHNGTVQACNLPDGNGVVFTLSFPSPGS